MELRTDAVQQVCHAVSRQVRDYIKNLELCFIVHRAGQRLESLALAGQELMTHPSADSALRILKSAPRQENSGLIGLTSWSNYILMGLASRQSIMALMTLNIDEFRSIKAVKAQCWGMAWQAIDLYRQRKSQEFAPLFSEGAVIWDGDHDNAALDNLKSDSFSAIMCALNGDKDMISYLARLRCQKTVEKQAFYKPEYYPFPIALDAIELAYRDMQRHPPARKRQIQSALQLAENVGRTYDDLSLQQWRYFCKPAQDMTWRGIAPGIILASAITTSPDTHIRSIAFLVSELSGIKPASALELDGIHSSFAEEKYTERLHQSIMERAFEKAAKAGLDTMDSAPFIEAANEQNEHLRDGNILGWCAAALQSAGKAFEVAISRGSKTPEQDARREFEGANGKTPWDTLKELGENIIAQYRQGRTPTLSDIIDLCNKEPAFASVSSSVSFTIKNPAYLKKIDIANALHTGPAPGVEPQAPVPKGPSLFAAPRLSVPGLGGNGSAPPPVRAQNVGDGKVRSGDEDRGKQ